MMLLGLILLSSGLLIALTVVIYVTRKEYKKYKKIESRYKNAEVLEFN